MKVAKRGRAYLQMLIVFTHAHSCIKDPMPIIWQHQIDQIVLHGIAFSQDLTQTLIKIHPRAASCACAKLEQLDACRKTGLTDD